MAVAENPRSSPLQLRPLTSRSVVLSLLLGAHPPELPARNLVRVGEMFGISESALRVTLSRMVAAGDLHRADGRYTLAQRLLDRQHRQDEAVRPATRDWDGGWEMAVVAVAGRSAADRAGLRADLTSLRLAELREGVWLRPANLTRPWPDQLHALVRRFDCQPPEGPAELARTLWDLDAWAADAEELLALCGPATGPADKFTAAAALVRHLLRDPALPPALLPPDWPGERLRRVYAAYRAELADLGRTTITDR
ncbi:PaaX family transcriptional regulator C-terminal domain-containing protein [Streptomyces sp. H27-D2]|uniref:PaaX family transcriptional regulator C-terminal domain-containing protein n=1 Tax=Streptomyces sp. H27-D2 TaxID=3046304 RepID=UPI002DBF7085|nr:PaaX family transcriptional regulator C-terminal domain-containing protein [Streptomyces sp. H27-D2]MEC4018620.1 PaaX family transcriptional regulator C-terminal domain-containing protein [Streptomyces sp. H27-D2]